MEEELQKMFKPLFAEGGDYQKHVSLLCSIWRIKTSGKRKDEVLQQVVDGYCKHLMECFEDIEKTYGLDYATEAIRSRKFEFPEQEDYEAWEMYVKYKNNISASVN